MKRPVFVTGVVTLLALGAALAQPGGMMNPGMDGSGWMGGYVGVWLPLLLIVGGLVVWIVIQKRK